MSKWFKVSGHGEWARRVGGFTLRINAGGSTDSKWRVESPDSAYGGVANKPDENKQAAEEFLREWLTQALQELDE